MSATSNGGRSAMSNGTFCHNISIKDDYLPGLLIFGCTGAVSAILCLVAIALLISFKMWKNRTNRIILYLMVAVFFFSFSIATQLSEAESELEGEVDKTRCIFEGFLIEYALWVKLLSTLMVTLHLGGMTHFYIFYDQYMSNKCVETFYCLFPWAFPILIAWIPFYTGKYGFSGPWCWLVVFDENCSLSTAGIAEEYALWYGEFFLVLIFNTVVVLSIAFSLCSRACKSKDQLTAQYLVAIKQVLPLIAYPIISQLLSFITIANRVTQVVVKGQYVRWLFYIHGFATPGWGLFGGLFTIIYIMRVANWKCKCTGKTEEAVSTVNINNNTVDFQTERYTTYGTTVINPTTFEILNESDVDEQYIVIERK